MIHHGKEMAASFEARFQYYFIYGEKIYLCACCSQHCIEENRDAMA